MRSGSGDLARAPPIRLMDECAKGAVIEEGADNEHSHGRGAERSLRAQLPAERRREDRKREAQFHHGAPEVVGIEEAMDEFQEAAPSAPRNITEKRNRHHVERRTEGPEKGQSTGIDAVLRYIVEKNVRKNGSRAAEEPPPHRRLPEEAEGERVANRTRQQAEQDAVRDAVVIGVRPPYENAGDEIKIREIRKDGAIGPEQHVAEAEGARLKIIPGGHVDGEPCR